MKRWLSLVLAAVTTGAAVFLLTSPMRAIGAEDRGAVHAKGTCDMGSTWELTMKPETGIKFEVTIETGVPDQDWNVTLKYMKHVLLQVTERTEEDGGFEVAKVENNKVGEDSAFVLARNVQTGESCWGKLMAEL